MEEIFTFFAETTHVRVKLKYFKYNLQFSVLFTTYFISAKIFLKNSFIIISFLQFHLDFCFFVFSNLLIYCILLLCDILTESFYKEKKARASNEVKRVIVAAAKLLKNAIKNHDHFTNVYPNIDENVTATNVNVPNLFRVFVSELIKLNLKQNSI